MNSALILFVLLGSLITFTQPTTNTNLNTNTTPIGLTTTYTIPNHKTSKTNTDIVNYSNINKDVISSNTINNNNNISNSISINNTINDTTATNSNSTRKIIKTTSASVTEEEISECAKFNLSDLINKSSVILRAFCGEIYFSSDSDTSSTSIKRKNDDDSEFISVSTQSDISGYDTFITSAKSISSLQTSTATLQNLNHGTNVDDEDDAKNVKVNQKDLQLNLLPKTVYKGEYLIRKLESFKHSQFYVYDG